MHALAALCGVARFHQVAADPALLAHQLGISSSDYLGIDDLLRGAQHLGLKAKLTKTTAERLALTALPALALMRTPDQSLRERGLHTTWQMISTRLMQSSLQSCMRMAFLRKP